MFKLLSKFPLNIPSRVPSKFPFKTYLFLSLVVSFPFKGSFLHDVRNRTNSIVSTGLASWMAPHATSATSRMRNKPQLARIRYTKADEASGNRGHRQRRKYRQVVAAILASAPWRTASEILRNTMRMRASIEHQKSQKAENDKTNRSGN